MALRRMLLGITWILVTVLFFYLMIDTGKVTGSALEHTLQWRFKQYDTEKSENPSLSPEETAERMLFELGVDYSKSKHGNQVNNFKSKSVSDSIVIFLYVVITLICYHFAFVYKKK